MNPSGSPWLVVVDMQRCFSDPHSDWVVPDYSVVEPAVDALVRQFGANVVLTRFVSGPTDTPAWRAYYQRWPRMSRPPDDPVWHLTLEAPPGARLVTRSTFSKWDHELAGLIPVRSPVVLCGVATETCVMATALDAIDGGHHVLVVPDACAGASRALHDAALHVLRSYAPQIGMLDVETARTLRAHR